MKTDWIFDGIEAWINEEERTHNENLGRKHCSSLCSQSEGHGHVAKIWGMTLLIFFACLAATNT